MIDLTLDFLCKQVNEYLRIKLDPTPSSDAIILYNVSHLSEGSSSNGSSNNTTSNAFLTLVNVEEDRIAKQHENFLRRDNTIVYKNPEILLNLYILFSVNLNSYTEALKRLSLIIGFFQNNNVFTPLTHPELSGIKVDKLIADLHSLTFEQLNHLWSVLGGKYLPSVLYKVRQITINEELTVAESEYIGEIKFHKHSKATAL